MHRKQYGIGQVIQSRQYFSFLQSVHPVVMRLTLLKRLTHNGMITIAFCCALFYRSGALLSLRDM